MKRQHAEFSNNPLPQDWQYILILFRHGEFSFSFKQSLKRLKLDKDKAVVVIRNI